MIDIKEFESDRRDYSLLDDVHTISQYEPDFKAANEIRASSKILMTKFNELLAQSTSKNKLLSLTGSVLLSKSLEITRRDLYACRDNLTNEINKAEDQVNNFKEALKYLKNNIGDLQKNTRFEADALGIITVNELKLSTYDQQVSDLKVFVDDIGKFSNVTIFHARTLLSNVFDKEKITENDIVKLFRKKILLLSKQVRIAASISLFLSIAGLYNVLASTFNFTYTSTEKVKKIVSSSSSAGSGTDLNQLNQNLLFLMDNLQIFGSAIFVIFIGFAGFQYMSRQEFPIVPIFLGMAGLVSMTIFRAMFGVPTTEQVVVKTIEHVNVYEFVNGGWSLTLGLILAAITVLIYCYTRFKQLNIFKAELVKSVELSRNLDKVAAVSLEKNTDKAPTYLVAGGGSVSLTKEMNAMGPMNRIPR